MDNSTAVKTCPICGKAYSGFPAISRKDNKTEICSECGAVEAVEAFEAAIKAKEAGKWIAKTFTT